MREGCPFRETNPLLSSKLTLGCFTVVGTASTPKPFTIPHCGWFLWMLFAAKKRKPSTPEWSPLPLGEVRPCSEAEVDGVRRWSGTYVAPTRPRTEVRETETACKPKALAATIEAALNEQKPDAGIR